MKNLNIVISFALSQIFCIFTSEMNIRLHKIQKGITFLFFNSLLMDKIRKGEAGVNADRRKRRQRCHPNWGGARAGAGKKKRREYVQTGFYLSPETKSSLDTLCKELNVSRSVLVDSIISEVLKSKLQFLFVLCLMCGQIIGFVPTLDGSTKIQHFHCPHCLKSFSIEFCELTYSTHGYRYLI